MVWKKIILKFHVPLQNCYCPQGLNWPGWLAGITVGAHGMSKYLFLEHFSGLFEAKNGHFKIEFGWYRKSRRHSTEVRSVFKLATPLRMSEAFLKEPNCSVQLLPSFYGMNSMTNLCI